MKKFTLPLLLLLLAAAAASAQESERLPHQRFALGFEFGAVQADPQFGANLTSPYFWHNALALRASARLAEHQYDDLTSMRSQTANYQLYKLGFVATSYSLAPLFRFYGEAGVAFLLPDKELSKEKSIGGYGHLGFEFFLRIDSSASYFIELGTVAVDAIAEEALFPHRYCSGFSISIGVRYYL